MSKDNIHFLQRQADLIHTGHLEFQYISREDFNKLSALDQQLFLKDNSFINLDSLALDNYKLDMRLVGKVLTSNGVALDIPYNINGRTTQVNQQIVLTALWIYIK